MSDTIQSTVLGKAGQPLRSDTRVADTDGIYANAASVWGARAEYKTSEIGTIPADWDLYTLGSLFRLSNGVNADKEAYGHGTPFINVLEVITNSHMQERDIPGKVLLRKTAREAFAVLPGDVLFNRTSETQEEVGLSSVYCGSAPVVFGGFVIRGRAVSNLLDSTYAGYGLRAQSVRRQIVAQGQGAIRSNIGQASLRRVQVPLPTLDEQRAIAEALSDVDGLLRSLDALIAKKRSIKQAAMQQLLTGKTRLPSFSGDWEVRALGELVTFLSGGTPSRGTALYWSGEIPWISASSLRTFYVWRSDANLTKEGVAAGSRMAPVGATLLLVRGSALHNEILAGLVTRPVCFNQDVKALVPNSSLVPEFLTFYLRGKADELLRLVRSAGNTAGVLDTKILKAFEILLPAKCEQEAISAALADIDAEIAAIEARREKTHAIKQGMMQQLLTGRVRLVPPSTGMTKAATP